MMATLGCWVRHDSGATPRPAPSTPGQGRLVSAGHVTSLCRRPRSLRTGSQSKRGLTRVHAAFENGGPEISAPKAQHARGLRDAGQQGQVPDYHLSPLDTVLLALFRRALLQELGGKDEEVPGFTGVARLIQRLHRESRNAEHVQERGSRVLSALLPPWFARAFGAFLSVLPPWFAARHATASSVLFLNWLVGPSEVINAPDDLLPDDRSDVPPNAAAALTGQDMQATGYRQGVLVKRCRVLEETKCASVCLNVCQVPTQRFFTEDIGLPMTMSPNFDTFECQFVFGRVPPAPADSDAFTSPCFKQCDAARKSARQCDVKPYDFNRVKEMSEDEGLTY